MRAKANETERAYMAAKLELESVDGEISALEEKIKKLRRDKRMPRRLPIR